MVISEAMDKRFAPGPSTRAITSCTGVDLSVNPDGNSDSNAQPCQPWDQPRAVGSVARDDADAENVCTGTYSVIDFFATSIAILAVEHGSLDT
jgi:hypothetical protein